MYGILAASLLTPASYAAEGPDISAALTEAKKPKWDPKGKTLDSFARAKTKFRNNEHDASVPGFLDALGKQAGCGECLDYLSTALFEAKHYPQAIEVGLHLEKLFPEKAEGPDIVARSHQLAENFDASTEAIERILLLEDRGKSTKYWAMRNDNYISQADLSKAMEVLEGADAAEVKEPDANCMRIQVLAVQKEPAKARELWESCSESKALDLKRASEGWLALAEGDSELAGTRLMLSGNEHYARLAISFVRLEQEQYEPALNLANKYLEERDHVDGHLAKALALHALGRDDDAIKALDERLLADGWQQAHPAWVLTDVQLKPEGEDWPQVVGARALALKIELLGAAGDVDAAQTLFDEAVAVHGEHTVLGDALDAAMATEDGKGEDEGTDGG